MKAVYNLFWYIIELMLAAVIAWNFAKVCGEVYAYIRKSLRLREIRIAGNSGSTHFSNHVNS